MTRLHRAATVAAIALLTAGCQVAEHAAFLRPQPQAAALPQLTPSPSPLVSIRPVAALRPIVRAKPKPKPPPPPPPPGDPVYTPRGNLWDVKLSRGMSGQAVLRLQKRLVRLGYWLGDPTGRFDYLTHQAVLAFQKVRGLSRHGVVGDLTRTTLERAQRRPRSREGGDHIEVDLDRQVLLVVRDGRVRWILSTSTGNGAWYRNSYGGLSRAITPRGRFRVTWQVNGWRESKLGMLYRPKYFNGGIAVHGSYSVPSHPASHGCVRVSIAAANWIWASDYAPVGTTVRVY